MGFSPGEFNGYTMGHWEDGIHWEHTRGMIRLWSDDELTSLLVLDKDQARRCLDQLSLLVTMMESTS